MHFKDDHISDMRAKTYLFFMSDAFAWALKIWSRLLVPSFPARSRRIQLPNIHDQIIGKHTWLIYINIFERYR